MAVPTVVSSTLNARNRTMPEDSGVLLVVDDEPFNLDMLSRRLAKTGFKVHVAQSGREALLMIREIAFDLVLLDQMMPEMSGTEVLRALRLDEDTKMLPVVMVTAVASSDEISGALEDGANDYITKPVDYKVALARIRSQLTRRSMELALRQSEERYALALRASRDGLWDWNLSTGACYFSPRWKEMLGLEHPVVNDKETWFSRIVAADLPGVLTTIEASLHGTDEVLKCDYRMRHADGFARWMSCHAVIVRDANGAAVRLTGSQSDVTEEKTHDVLTGLPNRLQLISQLEWALERTGKPTVPADGVQDSFAILFLDLNEFKAINDTLGHLAGDKLLILITARLQLAANWWTVQFGNTQAPVIARMGGDEFAVFLQGKVSETTVVAFADELRRNMQQVFTLEGIPIHCAFSIGVSLANANHIVPEDVLREADIAMYTTKVESLGNIALFNPRMRDVATQQFELENDVRLAVSRGELRLAYQPKVDLATGAMYGVEALIRWQHPTRGMLQPGLFIPIAERTGTIVEIGKWVLREACEQVLLWQNEFPALHPLTLSVNLSPREFRQKDLVQAIQRTMDETGFRPSDLHFELTEGALFEDIASARETLYSLKQLGVGLDLDDFGTGYSSLKYLRELPFDSLKIDRYFIASLNPEEASSGELVGAILNMAEVLGLEVIAEGIETESHRATLSVLGCRFGQGYFFSKPLDADGIHTLLEKEQGGELRTEAKALTVGSVTALGLSSLLESA